MKEQNADKSVVASRIEPIPTLPIFFKLAGRRVVLVGGAQPVAWKAELLLAAGAQVEVFAAAPSAGVEALARTGNDPSIALIGRDWTADDLQGAALAIGAIEDDAEADRFRSAAQAAGVPVNVIDKPAFCDFQFGTLVVRSPLVLAITTDGAVPVLGQALRMRLEALLPAWLRDWTRAAQSWRAEVRDRNWDFAKRRRFWEVVAERALSPYAGVPDDEVKRRCFAAAEGEQHAATTGLSFVGCGSGDPDDTTLAALRVLQNAAVVVHDRDVPAVVVQLARREAEKHLAADDDDAIDRLLSARSQANLVWLGTGDPGQCPRWHRRSARLRDTVPRLHSVRGLDRCPRCVDRCRPLARNSETLAP